jgi:hypothetical protein
MSVPTFSLAYTSVRANDIVRVVTLWRERAETPSDIEVVIAVDVGNEECLKVAQSVIGAKVVIQKDIPFNCVKGWNLAAAHTTGKVIIAIADDFNPPNGWDQLLKNLPQTGWMESPHVVHVEDGYVHNIFVLAILTRKRYEQFGYVFYPAYESMFSDTEFTEVAYRDSVVIPATNLLFEHIHCDCGKRVRDIYDKEHSSKDRWNRGEMLFNYRKDLGFPLDAGPMADKGGDTQTCSHPKPSTVVEGEEIKENVYVAYIQATRDDICLNEVIDRLFDEGVRHFFFCIPDEYWSGKSTPQTEMDEVKFAAARIEKKGAKVRVKVFVVADYRYPGETRIETETRVRNDSLNWIRGEGYYRILIVDSDELWKRGTLNQIKDRVKQHNPSAISLPMVPVIGLPGYPVDNAQDRVTSYVGGYTIFRDCRTPVNQPEYIDSTVVYHLTGTRRTMEEIIEKHRQSGHYDDPEYLFEEWIHQVLPNIKPGFVHTWPNGITGLHMFTGYQIWKSVRNWSVEEWVDIPETMRQYFGLPHEGVDKTTSVMSQHAQKFQVYR